MQPAGLIFVGISDHAVSADPKAIVLIDGKASDQHIIPWERSTPSHAVKFEQAVASEIENTLVVLGDALNPTGIRRVIARCVGVKQGLTCSLVAPSLREGVTGDGESKEAPGQQPVSPLFADTRAEIHRTSMDGDNSYDMGSPTPARCTGVFSLEVDPPKRFAKDARIVDLTSRAALELPNRSEDAPYSVGLGADLLRAIEGVVCSHAAALR